MKKWLCLTAALVLLGILSRLPHPARDIAKLEPVQTVWVYQKDGALHLETDTGDQGMGSSLTEALSDLKDKADREIFPDTAEYLILDPQVTVTEDFYALLRPDCKVVLTDQVPDLEKASDFLTIHRPELTLAIMRERS